MKRLLRGSVRSPSSSKREEVTFTEDGWARAASSTGYSYPADAAAGAAAADYAAAEHGEAAAAEDYFSEGEYAEKETEGERVDHINGYTEEDLKEWGEEDEAGVYDGVYRHEEDEGEAAEEPAYEEGYEGYEAGEAEEAEEEEEEGAGYAAPLEEEGEEVYEHEGDVAEAEEEAEGEADAAAAAAAAAEGEEEHIVDENSLAPFTLAEIGRRVQVRHVEGKGRCLYTRKSLSPGEVIFVESPVLVAVPSLSPELWSLLTQLNEESPLSLPPIWHLAALCSLLLLDEEGLRICLDKWVPDPDAEAGEDVLRVCTALQHTIDIQLYQRLLQVWRYNSFGHHTETQGLVLYNRISMIAHSCDATACWHYGADEAFVLKARVALQAGDEITISYIGDEDLLKSTNIRREKLSGWLFTCSCNRCLDTRDPARGFRCPTCGTGTMAFKTEDDETTPNACTVCGTVADAETVEKYITFETAYAERLDETNKEDMRDAEMVYEQASRVFTKHWILFQVLPLPSYSLAWLYEEMGDVLWSRIQAKGKPFADSRLRLAGRHFEDAYNLLYILCGPEHEYTAAAATKRNEIDELITEV